MLGHNVLFCPDGFNSGEFVTHDVNFVNCDLRAYAFSRMRKEEREDGEKKRSTGKKKEKRESEKKERKREKGKGKRERNTREARMRNDVSAKHADAFT